MMMRSRFRARRAGLVMAALLMASIGVAPDMAAAEAAPKVDAGRVAAVPVAPPVAGVGFGVWADFDNLSLFQCPSYDCNEGWVNNGLPLPADNVAAICYLPGWKSPRGRDWVLLLSHQNNHVGFADIGDVTAQAGGFTPPSC